MIETPRVSGADDRLVGSTANPTLFPTSTGGQTHCSTLVEKLPSNGENITNSGSLF
jgi:hypothetical protein